MDNIQAIIKKIRNFFSKDFLDQQDQILIKSIYVINSLARGDFISGVSDIDILVIFQEKTGLAKGQKIADKLSVLLNLKFSECKTSHPGKIIDIPWEIHNRYHKSPLKCFRCYFKDTLDNHIFIFGEDILRDINLPDYGNKKLIMKKLGGLVEKYKKVEVKNFNDQNLLIGEIIRYFLLLQGIKTLNKFEILEISKEKDFLEITEFMKRYIDNKSSNSDQQKLNNSIIEKYPYLVLEK